MCLKKKIEIENIESVSNHKTKVDQNMIEFCHSWSEACHTLPAWKTQEFSETKLSENNVDNSSETGSTEASPESHGVS